MWQKIKEFISDLVFPKRCLKCDQEGSYLCLVCQTKIEFNQKAYCPLCKQTSSNYNICNNCQTKTALRAVFVVSNYNQQTIEQLVHNLKYRYVEDLAIIIAQLMADFMVKNRFLNEESVITCVPLHKKRQAERGFNQSQLIAKHFSQIMDLEYKELLIRTRNTLSQTQLKRKERQENVKMAFKVIENNLAKNKTIIIIDDVLTTGSTLNECAQVLAQQDYNNIYGLVLAQNDH